MPLKETKQFIITPITVLFKRTCVEDEFEEAINRRNKIVYDQFIEILLSLKTAKYLVTK